MDNHHNLKVKTEVIDVDAFHSRYDDPDGFVQASSADEFRKSWRTLYKDRDRGQNLVAERSESPWQGRDFSSTLGPSIRKARIEQPIEHICIHWLMVDNVYRHCPRSVLSHLSLLTLLTQANDKKTMQGRHVWHSSQIILYSPTNGPAFHSQAAVQIICRSLLLPISWLSTRDGESSHFQQPRPLSSLINAAPLLPFFCDQMIANQSRKQRDK